MCAVLRAHGLYRENRAARPGWRHRRHALQGRPGRPHGGGPVQGLGQAREGGAGAGAGRLHAGAQGQAGRVLVFVGLCRQPGAGVL